ncbi:MAG: hypothetical protein O6947_07160 [Acidobacteria bacterium]|nr:hypothetical protein [Acidobacteriota bacterium]
MKHVFAFLLTLLLGSFSWAAAQDFQYQGFGFRVGISEGPDQGYGGIHWDFGTPNSSLRIRPNIEIGFGDDTTLLAFNGEVDWYFRKQGDWFPYAGGAVALNFIERDDLPPQADDTNTEVGFYAVGGIETLLMNNRKFLVEVKIGFDDSPDFKLGVGWTF